MSSVEIHQTVDFAKRLKNPLVILGFPGTGLVGSVAGAQLAESLAMPFGGYITSPEFAPLAAIHNYKPMPAARIHYSEKNNLVLVLSEMTIPVSSSLLVADKIFEFARSIGAREILSLGGISLKENKNEVYFISSDPNGTRDAINRKIAKPIREGATTGVTGILLTKGAISRFKVTAILAEASEEYLDPGAAVNALKTFSLFTNIPVNTSALERDATILSETVKEAVVKSKMARRRGTGPATEEGGTSGNNPGSMYG